MIPLPQRLCYTPHIWYTMVRSKEGVYTSSPAATAPVQPPIFKLKHERYFNSSWSTSSSSTLESSLTAMEFLNKSGVSPGSFDYCKLHNYHCDNTLEQVLQVSSLLPSVFRANGSSYSLRISFICSIHADELVSSAILFTTKTISSNDLHVLFFLPDRRTFGFFC